MNYKKNFAFIVVLISATITYAMDTPTEKRAVFELEKDHGEWMGSMWTMKAGSSECDDYLPTIVVLKTLEELKSDFPKKRWNMKLKNIYFEKKDYANRLNELVQIAENNKKIGVGCIFEKEKDR